MLTKERKLEIYTERLHRLSFDLAMLAAQGNQNWQGIAIVADETRNASQKLYTLLDKGNVESLPDSITDALMQIEYLSFNGWLEMLRIGVDFDHEKKYILPSGTRCLAVVFDEIRNVAHDMRNLFGFTDTRYDLPQPELKKESRVSNARLFLLQATIGGEPFVENTAYVEEVHTYAEGDPFFDIQNGYFQLRGSKIPVVDCYSRFDLDRTHIKKLFGDATLLIINTAWEKEPSRYAVPVDALPQTFGFFSRFPEGESTDSRSKVFSAPYTRACWDTRDGGQMIFLDWKALVDHKV
jgi:chemotaxis signal transduction protein